MLCIKRLKDAGLTIVTDLGDAAPSGAARAAPPLGDAAAAVHNSSRDAMGQRMEGFMPLVSLPVADSILSYVSAAVTSAMRQLAKDTPLSIDRVQAARLYAGMLEVGVVWGLAEGSRTSRLGARGWGGYGPGLEGGTGLAAQPGAVSGKWGHDRWLAPMPTLACAPPPCPAQFGYFSRGLEAECESRGVAMGGDCEAMIKMADDLPEDELRSMCQVKVCGGVSAGGSAARVHKRTS
jgi:hypothetical protein